MRISQLQLHGFKSFADRSVFHFGDGISCVVGPNGCGKSNVVDALKWVIGEQSAKSLRGGEMQDVIFAGSAQRKAVSYAEVGLTFTAEGSAPFPGRYARYTELQIARRLYRSGESQYLINQDKVRRKDIVDLLMDSGVGNNLYSFIEQGRIGKIVSASPEERRGLIDEAAGITRYKQRRKETLSKLESTCVQLDRTADVNEERIRRVKTLERQVVKAAKFRRLRALVRQEETFLSMVKYIAHADELSDLTTQVDSLTDTVAAEEERQDVLEEELVLRATEVESAESLFEIARDALGEVDAQRREVEATLALHRQRGEELGRQLEEAREELAADVARVEQAELERSESAAILSRIGGKIEDAETAAAKADAELRVADAERDAARDIARTAELEAGQREERLQELRDRREALRARSDELPGRRARLETRTAAAADEAVVLDKRARVAAEVLIERRERVATLDEEIGAHDTRIDGLVRSELHARDALQRAEREHDLAQTTLDEAIQKAEATAGLADEEVAARVGVVQQREDNALREADRADASRVAQAEAAARSKTQAAEGRARAWLEAWARAEEAKVSKWRAGVEASVEEEDSRRQSEIDSFSAALTTEIEQAEGKARAELEDKVSALRTRREQAEERLEASREQMKDAEARRTILVQRRHDAEGRRTALQAEEEASRSRDAGAKAVAAALPDAPRLIDALDLDEDRHEEAARWLGDRMWLPVITSVKEVLLAAKAAAGQAASILLTKKSPSLDGLLAPVALVDDLEAAVKHHTSTGGAAMVRGTGERVDVDGVVRLGRQGDDVALSLRRREQIETATGEVDEAAAAIETLDAEVLAARAAIEGARLMVRKTTEQIEAVEREGRKKIRDATVSTRQQGEGRLRELREARGTWRRQSRQETESAVSERLARRDRDAQAMRTQADQGIAELRAASEQQLDALRSSLAEAREARVTESQGVVEKARLDAWEEVKRTTADVQVRREELRTALEGCRASLQSAREKVEKAGKRLAESRAERESLVRTKSEHELVVVRMEGERKSAEEQKASLSGRQTALAEERTSLDAAEAEVAAGLAEVTARLHEVEALGADIEGRLAEVRAGLSEKEERSATIREQHDALVQQVAELRERRASATATHDAAVRQLETAGDRQDQVRRRMGELEVVHTEALRASKDANTKLDALATQRQEAAARQQGAKERVDTVKTTRASVESEARTVATSLAENRHALVTAEQRLHQVRSNVGSMVERLDERYQLSLPELVAELMEKDAIRLEVDEEVREGLEIANRKVEPVGDLVIRRDMLDDEEVVREYVGQIEEHRAALAKIGDVNLTALEEYVEQRALYDESAAQCADLEEAVQTFRDAIAKMNRTCREDFRETFDRVNASFKQSYPKLVGGGEARLALTNEEDLLETGVEIYVRPPGKRLQNLTLLSGGEKAMTAIALLLALFEVKPSPFCVLDEVDAPLDEANGARFNDMVRHMSSMTQFIVITHNRKTMECADTLYGITMQTPGCSSLVTVKIDA